MIRSCRAIAERRLAFSEKPMSTLQSQKSRIAVNLEYLLGMRPLEASMLETARSKAAFDS